ncbi:hypothetical protein Hamer_G024489 [Homarus americanus]|uniref:Uncharacterized protein n=1 Tax=Homarus americanus TaxID=6706 RepID=A0A8J5MZB5_HOMAM|nr:hypothetical protein Hamer_G024489 [Homarus americanus]
MIRVPNSRASQLLNIIIWRQNEVGGRRVLRLNSVEKKSYWEITAEEMRSKKAQTTITNPSVAECLPSPNLPHPATGGRSRRHLTTTRTKLPHCQTNGQDSNRPHPQEDADLDSSGLDKDHSTADSPGHLC